MDRLGQPGYSFLLTTCILLRVEDTYWLERHSTFKRQYKRRNRMRRSGGTGIACEGESC